MCMAPPTDMDGAHGYGAGDGASRGEGGEGGEGGNLRLRDDRGSGAARTPGPGPEGKRPAAAPTHPTPGTWYPTPHT